MQMLIFNQKYLFLPVKTVVGSKLNSKCSYWRFGFLFALVFCKTVKMVGTERAAFLFIEALTVPSFYHLHSNCPDFFQMSLIHHHEHFRAVCVGGEGSGSRAFITFILFLQLKFSLTAPSKICSWEDSHVNYISKGRITEWNASVRGWCAMHWLNCGLLNKHVYIFLWGWGLSATEIFRKGF